MPDILSLNASKFDDPVTAREIGRPTGPEDTNTLSDGAAYHKQATGGLLGRPQATGGVLVNHRQLLVYPPPTLQYKDRPERGSPLPS